MLKKVVHFSRLYHPHVGGVEAHIFHLNQELIKSGVEPIVITQQHDKKNKLVERAGKITIYRLPILNPQKIDVISKTIYKIKLWKMIWQLKKVWLSADVIHIHDVFFWLLPFWPFVRNKIYITFHGHESEGGPSWKQKTWHKLAAFMCCGDISIGSFHPKWYGINSKIVSYGAVTQIKKSKVKRKSSHLIFIGRLEPVNGLMEILKSLLILKQQGKKYHLDVYGEGPQQAAAKKFVQKNHLDTIFHGANPQARDYLSLYQVAFVSRYLAILESLSVGTKVIAFSQNELTDDYLRLAPFAKWISITHNPDEIIGALYNQSNLNEKAVNWAGRQTWGKLAQQYLSLWQNKK